MKRYNMTPTKIAALKAEYASINRELTERAIDIASLKAELHHLNPMSLPNTGVWDDPRAEFANGLLRIAADNWRDADIAWADDYLSHHAEVNRYDRGALAHKGY